MMEYVCQYQTLGTKEWGKVIFSGEFNLDGPDGFQKYRHTKIFQKRITQQNLVE